MFEKDRTLLVSGLFTFYGVLLLEVLAYFAIRYTPENAGSGVQGFNIFLPAFLQFLLLGWFCFVEKSNRLSKKVLYVPWRAVIFVALYGGIAWVGTNGWSNAFMGVILIYAVLLALTYEVHHIPIEPEKLKYMNDDQLKFYATNWRFAVQLILTASIATGVGLFYKGLTTDNFVPLHLIVLLGMPGIGLLYVILRLLEKIRSVNSYLRSDVYYT